MGQTTVGFHTRRGYPVRAHSRQVAGMAVADVLARDLDRVLEQLDQEGATERIVWADPHCPHPSWYPVRHVDGTSILAYGCTDCASTKPADEARERALAEGRDE